MSHLHNIFNVNAVKGLLQLVETNGVGFIIPEYQRPYRWPEENVERLMSDLLEGVNDVYLNGADESTLFLGTLLVVQTPNSDISRYIADADYSSPAGMYYIVDGQQRLSTMAILAVVLHRKINTVLNQLQTTYENNEQKDDFIRTKNIVNQLILNKLKKFYCVTINGTANPQDKPIIIRKGEEFWQRNGDDKYVSPIARFIADYIRTQGETDYSNMDERYGYIQVNQKKITNFIEQKLCIKDSFTSNEPIDEEIVVNKIIKKLFPETHHIEIKLLFEGNNAKDNNISELIKMCLFSLYFFEYCCVNYLEPKTHQWAIEVFQSLNSTGMPLTSLEVYKAYVYQNRDKVREYNNIVNDAFESVESLVVESDNPANQTNIYLTALALGFDGTKLGTQYKKQEKYLKDQFNNNNRRELIFKYMLHMSEYMHFRNKPDSSFVTNPAPKIELAYLSLLFLDAMNFHTVHPLLALFYNDNDLFHDDFIDACNATAAFYALWRSVQSSSNLDTVARTLMENNVQKKNNHVVMNWLQSLTKKKITIQEYKLALKNILEDQGILQKDSWLDKARGNLDYPNSSILCRFILFLSIHNTMSDGSGGIQLAMDTYYPFLKGGNWKGSENFSTVEHIAPQNPKDNSSWHSGIYGVNSQGPVYHSIGNLTLLPKSMNSIVGNLDWNYKHKFYAHLANPSIQSRNELLQLDGKGEVRRFTKAAKKVLGNASSYFPYLQSIVVLPSDTQSWTREIIEKRTEQICSLAYDRLSKWLEV